MNRRLQLVNWVKAQHEGQLIKESGEPYLNHLLMVANQAATTSALAYEIGLCHDLLEKTTVTEARLQSELMIFGYDRQEAGHIAGCVTELTKQFTKQASPLPKKERKALEDERLLTISADAQTVKYADLLYNAGWMMSYDRHHAPAYLGRMTELVTEMTAGDADLRDNVLLRFRELLYELEKD